MNSSLIKLETIQWRRNITYIIIHFVIKKIKKEQSQQREKFADDSKKIS